MLIESHQCVDDVDLPPMCRNEYHQRGGHGRRYQVSARTEQYPTEGKDHKFWGWIHEAEGACHMGSRGSET